MNQDLKHGIIGVLVLVAVVAVVTLIGDGLTRLGLSTWFDGLIVAIGAVVFVRTFVIRAAAASPKPDAPSMEPRVLSVAMVLIGMGNLWPGHGLALLGGLIIVVPVLAKSWLESRPT